MNRLPVWLTIEDVGHLTVLAYLRDRKEVRQKTFKLHDNLGHFDMHIIGLLGETAFAKEFGLQVDNEIHAWAGDDGWDFELNGKKVDVKTCVYYDDPELKIRIDKYVPEVDLYVLCAVKNLQMQQVDLVGYATRDMLKTAQRKQYKDGKPMNYVFKEHQLRDIRELK